jgi:hypothetical protein
VYLLLWEVSAVREQLQKAQESRGFKRKSSEEFIREAELGALAGERESAMRLLKRALWNAADDKAQPIQEKIGRVQQRYGR